MQSNETISDVYQIHCVDVIRRRKECWDRSLEGKQGEECIREELKEKRCLSSYLCPSQSKNFYVSKQGECSKWAEAFAFGPNDTQRTVLNDRKKMKHCRKVVHKLSKCMSKYSSYIYQKS
jgi:hypothetical protein